MSLSFAKRVDALKPSATLALDARVKAMKQAGADVISFGVGEPDFDTPLHIKNAGKKAIDEGFTKYTPSGGTESLKKAIAARFKTDCGVEVKPAEILVSSGAKHSLFNIAVALFEEGDEVIIPAPYWVSYPEQVAVMGAKPVFVNTGLADNFKMTAALLEKAVTKHTKALILNSPSNPTGMVYSKDELKAILAVCKKHSFYIISDEIYDKLIYDREFTSVLTLAKDDAALRERVVIVNGVSKTYAMTGWRIGYIIAPEKVAKQMDKIQSQSTSNPCSISQRATEAALNESQEEVAKMLAEFKKRRDLIVSLLHDIKGVKVKSPEGSFYVFPDFSAFVGRTAKDKKIHNTFELCEYLLEEALCGIVPGEAFGAPGFVRFSFAASQETIRKGLSRIREALEKLK